MKFFFSNIWKYLTLLFAGIAAGMVAAIKLIEKPTVLNVATDTFVAEQTQRIGKIKQRGQGNSLDTSLLPEIPTRKEKRIARRAARHELRLEKETQMEEQDLKDP
jgi:hypothetical protein